MAQNFPKRAKFPNLTSIATNESLPVWDDFSLTLLYGPDTTSCILGGNGVALSRCECKFSSLIFLARQVQDPNCKCIDEGEQIRTERWASQVFGSVELIGCSLPSTCKADPRTLNKRDMNMLLLDHQNLVKLQRAHSWTREVFPPDRFLFRMRGSPACKQSRESQTMSDKVPNGPKS